MNKMLIIVGYVLMATSLYGDNPADQNPEPQRITLNFNIKSKEDIFTTLNTLERIIPIISMQEIGGDESRKRMAIEFNKRVERMMASNSVRSMIHSVAANLLAMQARESFSEKVIGFVEMGKMIEEAQLCGKLHMFLQTSEGKDFLNMYEIMIKHNFNSLPFFLTLFYALREIAREIAPDRVEELVL